MFDLVADRYDLLNDVLSLGQDRLWRRVVARTAGAKDGELVLDLAAGTGTSSRTFTTAGARCVACDFSLGMLQVGARQPAPGVGFVAGDALDLPFRDSSFDAITISFGLTKPGGRLVICEFGKLPGRLNDLYEGYLTTVLPRIARRVSGNAEAYDYLTESIKDWPAQPELARRIGAAGWTSVRWRNLSMGVVAIHVGRRPG